MNETHVLQSEKNKNKNNNNNNILGLCYHKSIYILKEKEKKIG